MIQDFKITKITQGGRLGRLYCDHGVIDTPAFVFCATKGAIKGATIDVMKAAETQVLLSNTYNLMDYPGGDLIEQSGGLHKMMGWDGPMFTDSGGFQVFSMGYGSVSDEIKGKRSSKGFEVKIDEDGIIFQSPRDGIRRRLTPESSMQIQHQIGSDFAFVLDECTPYHMNRAQVEACMHRSHRWEERSLNEVHRIGSKQGIYGIVQGGVYEDLRMQSIDFVNSMPFFGHGIGGSLGSTKDEMCKILSWCHKHLKPERPKHLLGIGKMANIEAAVQYGIDTFDCVHPTRIARHGCALVSKPLWVNDREHIVLKNSKYKYDFTPLDPTCECSVCKNYTRSYIHYLITAGEMLGAMLLVEHNVAFMNQFMGALRQKIQAQ